jgi:hypothetical protein
MDSSSWGLEEVWPRWLAALKWYLDQVGSPEAQNATLEQFTQNFGKMLNCLIDVGAAASDDLWARLLSRWWLVRYYLH